MKKCLTALLILAAASVVTAGYVTAGFGRVKPATVTPQLLRAKDDTASFGSKASIVVLGTENVYVMLNTETDDFVLDDATPVAPGFPYTFDNKQRVFNVCYATSNGTSEVIIAFQ